MSKNETNNSWFIFFDIQIFSSLKLADHKFWGGVHEKQQQKLGHEKTNNTKKNANENLQMNIEQFQSFKFQHQLALQTYPTLSSFYCRIVE
jgi:hypothetical protein